MGGMSSDGEGRGVHGVHGVGGSAQGSHDGRMDGRHGAHVVVPALWPLISDACTVSAFL